MTNCSIVPMFYLNLCDIYVESVQLFIPWGQFRPDLLISVNFLVGDWWSDVQLMPSWTLMYVPSLTAHTNIGIGFSPVL